MIGNNPRISNPGEGKDHFSTKVLTARLADAAISSSASDSGYYLLTLYEFLFKPVILDSISYDVIGGRCYSGDVVLLFYRDRKIYQYVKNSRLLPYAEAQEKADHIINYEIDGLKGHSTVIEQKKNRIRDEELLKLNIHVHRIPVYKKKERIEFIDTLQREVLEFYYEHPPKVIA